MMRSSQGKAGPARLCSSFYGSFCVSRRSASLPCANFNSFGHVRHFLSTLSVTNRSLLLRGVSTTFAKPTLPTASQRRWLNTADDDDDDDEDDKGKKKKVLTPEQKAKRKEESKDRTKLKKETRLKQLRREQEKQRQLAAKKQEAEGKRKQREELKAKQAATQPPPPPPKKKKDKVKEALLSELANLVPQKKP